MDNLSVHKTAKVLTEFKKCGIKLLFNAAYFPEINLVEYIFNEIKK